MRQQRRGARIALWLLAVGSLASALVAIWYTVQAASTPAIAGSRADLDAALDAVDYGDSEAWYDAWEPFVTNRAALEDAAEGWGVLATCLGLALVVAGYRRIRGSYFPFAPSRKYVAPLAVILVLLAQYPFIAFYFSREIYERLCCPSWADTPIIPMFGWSLMVTAYAAVVFVVVSLLLRFGGLPAPLLGWRAPPLRQCFVSAVTLPLAILSLFIAWAGLSSLASIVALGLVCAWALLVARAAALSPRWLRA